MDIGDVNASYSMMARASAAGDVQRLIAMKVVKDQAAAQNQLVQKLILESQLKTNSKGNFDTYA